MQAAPLWRDALAISLWSYDDAVRTVGLELRSGKHRPGEASLETALFGAAGLRPALAIDNVGFRYAYAPALFSSKCICWHARLGQS